MMGPLVRRLSEVPNTKAPWASADYALLIEMIQAGKSIQEIAQVMGRSQEAVRNKAQRRGLLSSRSKKKPG